MVEQSLTEGVSPGVRGPPSRRQPKRVSAIGRRADSKVMLAICQASNLACYLASHLHSRACALMSMEIVEDVHNFLV